VGFVHTVTQPHTSRRPPRLLSPSTLAPLRLPDFRRLAGAYLVNEAGNWLGDVALAIVVYGASHSTLATALLLLLTRGIPSLLAPAAAARLAHLSLRRALPALYLAEALIMGALALLLGSLPWVAIVAVAAVDGLVAVAARSVSRAAVATLLAPAGLLVEGNSLINVAFTVAGTVGPPLAGVLYATLGGGATLAVDAATFAGAAALLVGLTPRALVDDETAGQWRERLR
jgi:predicted MFS family arabinose efflux permease